MLPGLGSAIVGAQGGIQFVGGAVAGKAGATSGNSTIALNSGLTGGIASAAQSGDFVLAAFASASIADRTLAITDGTNNYTLIGSELYGNDATNPDVNLRVAYKFITSDTDVTFGPTGNADDAGVTGVYVFRGVNTTTPLDATPTTYTGASSFLSAFASITPVTPGSVIVLVGGAADPVFNEAWYEPGGSGLEHFLSAFQADTYDCTLGLGYDKDWTSGVYDPVDWPLQMRVAALMTIALRPA